MSPIVGVVLYGVSLVLWVIAIGLGFVGLARLVKGGPGHSTQDIVRGSLGAGMVLIALLIANTAKVLWVYAATFF